MFYLNVQVGCRPKILFLSDAITANRGWAMIKFNQLMEKSFPTRPVRAELQMPKGKERHHDNDNDSNQTGRSSQSPQQT